MWRFVDQPDAVVGLCMGELGYDFGVDVACAIWGYGLMCAYSAGAVLYVRCHHVRLSILVFR